MRADYVICALPPPVPSTLALVGCPAHVTTAVARHTTAAASKTLLHVREPFWTREGVHTGGGSASDQLIRQVYYPPPTALAASERCGCAVITAGYATDADKAPLCAMDEPERTNAVVRALGRMHPGVPVLGMVLGRRTMDWHRHPYSLGAFDGDWMPDSSADRTAGPSAAAGMQPVRSWTALAPRGCAENDLELIAEALPKSRDDPAARPGSNGHQRRHGPGH